MRPSLRKALVAAAAVVAVAASGQQAEAEGVQQAGGGLEAVADLLHPQDWLNDKQMRAPPADAAPRFREEENAAAAAASGSGSASSGSDDSGSDDSGSDDSASGSDASDDSGSDASDDSASGSSGSDDSASGSSGSDDSASGSSGSDDSASGSSGSEEAGGSSSDDSSSSSDADGVMSSFSQEGTGAASGDVGSASSSSGSGAGGDEAPSSSSSGSVVDAEKTLPTRGPLGRRTQDNRGAVTYANGKRMVVPVIAETNSDKPVGVVPPQVTSEKPARVVGAGPADDAHGCASGSEDAACQPGRYAHVPHTVDQLQALPASVASTQHVGLDDKASAAKRALEEGKFAPHPDNFNLENALEHPERLLSVHPPVPETTEQLVREARAEVLGKVSSKADRDALAKLGVNVDRVAAAEAAGQPEGAAAAEAGNEAEDRQKALLEQQREEEAAGRAPVRKVEKALHQELAEQLRGFERDRKALRMQIGDTKRALAELSMPDGATPLPGLDPHLSLEGDLGQIDDPADPVTGLPNPALKELTAGQRHRRVQAAVEALRGELAERRQARAGKGAPKETKAERELADVARAAAPAGSPLALRRDGERERREEARRHPLATAVRQRAAGDAAKVDSDQLDASLTGLGRKGAAQLKAAGSGVPGARPALVDELAQLAVKRLETPESDAQQTNTLELEMELVALDLKKALEKQESKEEALKERVSGTELAEDEELHRLVTKLADLHHMHKSLGGKAKQQMLAQIANTIVAIKQLYPNPTTLVEGQARVQARAAAEAKAGLPPMDPRTHFEPAYVDSLCGSRCTEARQTCQSACTQPDCHAQCAQAHAQCCPQANPSLVAVSSASSAASTEHVRATPECFARFQECSSNHTQCASQCQEHKPCHEQCAKAHEECRSPCKVEADEVVRDACGRCHLVPSQDQGACQRQECKASPVTVATDAAGVSRVDQEQPAAHDGKEHLPSSLTEQLLATFLKDQMKFNRDVMKQLQELKEAKGATAPAAKAKLDAAKAPKPPAAEEAVQKKDEVVRGAEEKEEEKKKEEEKADAKLDNLLRFASERVGDSVPAVHTVPVPKVHAHHTRPMPALAHHRARRHADGVVSHLEDMLSEIKDDTA